MCVLEEVGVNRELLSISKVSTDQYGGVSLCICRNSDPLGSAYKPSTFVKSNTLSSNFSLIELGVWSKVWIHVHFDMTNKMKVKIITYVNFKSFRLLTTWLVCQLKIIFDPGNTTINFKIELKIGLKKSNLTMTSLKFLQNSVGFTFKTR